MTLKWDYTHQIDLAEEDAREDCSIEPLLSLAQSVTKTFRYGKEYARLFSRTVECISLTDFVQDLPKIGETELSLLRLFI